MSDDTPREGERIAKLLARAGVASRREVERLIAEGRVRLNDELVTTPATVLTSLEGITVDGRPVRAAEAARIFAFHKPSGLITAERDPAGRATIYTALRNALPKGTPRVMPVGRLDLNTEGLLLLTNDGELKRALELPSSGVPRTYRARTFGDITQNRLEELMEGIEIEGVRYGRIDANMERRTGRNQWIELTLTEGKNREVRRVLEALGLQVSRLLRVAYGPYALGDLPRGMAVEIAPAQVERFAKALEAGKPRELGAPRPVWVGPPPEQRRPERVERADGPRTERARGGQDRPERGRPERAERPYSDRLRGERSRGDRAATGRPRTAGADRPDRATSERGAGDRVEDRHRTTAAPGRTEREQPRRGRSEAQRREREPREGDLVDRPRRNGPRTTLTAPGAPEGTPSGAPRRPGKPGRPRRPGGPRR